jgi:hypothetical protein
MATPSRSELLNFITGAPDWAWGDYFDVFYDELFDGPAGMAIFELQLWEDLQ